MRVVTLLLALGVAACGDNAELPDPPNVPVIAEHHTGLLDDPGLDPDEVVAISRDFLARMRPMIATPDHHRVAQISEVHAIPGTDAWTLDPCIPRVDDPTTVWVARGVGDFLNLVDFAWSRHYGQLDEGFELACREVATSGTIVIDDTTGYILGVYPGDHQGLQAEPGDQP